jgi:sensor histidine kinase YesM
MRCEGGSIEIEAKRSGDALVIVMRDDGPGCKNFENRSNGHGVGLANTRERLQVLYGNRQQFSLSNREPHGVEIRIELPFEAVAKSNAA